MAKGMTIRMRKRALFTGIIVILILFVVLILRLIKLQIISGSNFLKMANEQQLRSTKLNAKRGTIYDRNMVPLAQSATVWNVVLEPNYIKNEKMRELICQGLHEILDIPKEKIYKLSQKKSFYIIVKKKIESDLKDRIINFKSKSNITNGIRLIEDYKRYYPFGRFASVILGFTGCDGQGLSGLENYYDKTLRGEQGKLVNAKNAIGTDMPFDYEQIISSKDGHSLILTIDATIQRILECNLRLGIKNNDVRNRAAAIAINPNTGEILGMAIEESFDPNDPFKVEKEEYLTLEERISKAYKNFENRAITNYYAGSVFKPMVAAWALDLNLIDKEWVFNCSGGIKISDRAPYIRCHKRTGHGTLNLDQGICKSCNPMFIKIGEKIGEKNFFEKFEFSGFHERTRIDLPGEANSIFFSKDGKMKPIDLAVASIGQNFAITPIQMIIGICAIANGGNLLRPYIVKEIIDFKGNIIKSFSKEIRRTIISEQTARRVAAMMAENVIDGGARNAYIPGFRVAGKTGTSEKKDNLLIPGQKDYISSFCGFAPVDSPEIVLLILLDTPKGQQYYGSIIAAPIFASAMSEILPYLGVQTQYTDEEMEKYGTQAPNLIKKKIDVARNEAISLGFKPTIIGKGTSVVSQIPNPNDRIPKSGSIVIYTEKTSNETVKVPNFVGLTKSKAKKIADSIGINLLESGSKEDDLIVMQFPSESEIVTKGSVVNVVVQKTGISD